MKSTVLITLGLLVSLCACNDEGAATQPVATAGVGATAGAPAGTGAAAGVGGSLSNGGSGAAGRAGSAGTAAGSGGRPATAGTGGTGAGAAGTGAAGSGVAGGAPEPAAGNGGTGGTGGTAGTGGTGGSQGTAGTDPLPPLPADKALPIVFVHGYAGSANQYQSQAMRFVANGYPADRIRAFDHDGAGIDAARFIPDLDAIVDGVLAEFEVSQVYLVGHSRGTFVSTMYVGDATRRAKVAKYIAIDGGACPSSVPCIAPNQQMFRGQEHVEVCTSKESFAMQYEFLLGSKPQVVDVVRQRAPVVISGRAVNFPENSGREGTMLKIYALEAATGARAQPDPLAMFTIGADGHWGPVTVDPETLYEMELSAPTGSTTHFYSQRFLRSTDFVRLLSGPPDSASRMNTNVSDKHAALVVSRQREFLATDVLEISTKSPSGDQPVVNAMTSAAGAAMSIGLHIHDAAASPGNSSLAALPYFSNQAFQYGVDVFMPAAEPPDGVITIRNLPRGDAAKPQVLNVPNWQSSKHIISIALSDFPLE